MAEGYTLSAEFLRAIRGMLERAGQMPPVDAGRPLLLPGDDLTTPEVYVALTPGGGIPALATDLIYGATGTGTGTGTGVGGGNTPGSADCRIYRVVNTEGVADLTDAGFTRTVHNLSTTAIAGGAWVLAVRDKWGIWWAIDPAGGGGSGGTATGYRPEEYYRWHTVSGRSPWVNEITEPDYTFHLWGHNHPVDQAVASIQPVGLILIALPFLSSIGSSSCRLAVRASSGSSTGGVVRLGIYSNLDDREAYPGSKLYDSGDLSMAAAGLVQSSSGVALEANTLYWIVFVSNAVYPGVDDIWLSSLSVVNGWPILGCKSLDLGDGLMFDTGYGWVEYNRVDTTLPTSFTAIGDADVYAVHNQTPWFGGSPRDIPAVGVRLIN